MLHSRHPKSISYNRPRDPVASFLSFPALATLLLGHLLRHRGVVLLEALAQAHRRGLGLLHAALDAGGLAGGQGLGGEVVDARVEAVVY